VDDPRAESRLPAAVRDIVAGAVLVTLGVVTGGTSLFGRGDGIDVAFDVLGAVWIAWGLWRLVRWHRARSTASTHGRMDAAIKDPDRSDR
jgi:hypothetical protein